jgi:diguanylate cyclase (GGDEF)-like protein
MRDKLKGSGKTGVILKGPASKGAPSETKRAAPAIAIGLLIMSMAVSFLGYNYLYLAGEYRARNFQHFLHLKQAHDLVGQSPLLRAADIDTLKNHLTSVRAEALWCTDNLTAPEYAIVNRLGAAPAFAMCRAEVARTDELIEQLKLMRAAPIAQHGLQSSRFAQGLEVKATLEKMMTDSANFHSQVQTIENRIVNMVIGGTLLVSFALLMIMMFLTRTMREVWTTLTTSARHVNEVNERFATAVEAIPDGFAVFDSKRRLVTCNEVYRQLAHPIPERVTIGMTGAEILQDAMEHGHYPDISEEDRNKFILDFRNKLEQDGSQVSLVVQGERYIQVKLTESAHGDKVVIRSDVSDFVQSNRKLQNLTENLETAKAHYRRRSLEDALTGLSNRRKLDHALKAAGGRGERAVIRIDLDRFKQVNDVLGHDAGDHVLKTVARKLLTATREDDLVARVGGDEFVVLCAPGTELERAEDIGQRLLERTLEPILYRNKQCVFSASLGLAVAEISRDDPSEILRNADAALYEAKAAGRASLRVFTGPLEQRISRDRRLADDLVEAFAGRELVPFYQTQHDVHTHAVTGIEVLARWQHPEFGLLPPALFFPIAHQLGLDGDLDLAIMTRAAEDLAPVFAKTGTLPRLAFNVTSSTLIDPDFPEFAQHLFKRWQAPVAFEILESVSLEDGDDTIPFALDTLRELGFELDIDDFGSGHASIKSVMQVRPHALKIDRSIILPLGEDPAAEGLVAATITMGQSLGLQVIAEGVETAQHAHRLAALGCDTVQGYHFSKPMPLKDLKTYLDGDEINPGNRSAAAS